MDTGVRAGPCSSFPRTIPGTRSSRDPWQDLSGARHPPVTVSAGAGQGHPGTEGLCWALGWRSGALLGHCWGLWPPLQPWLVALGVPDRWAAAFKGSIRCIMWGWGPSGEVARGPHVPLWCWGEALALLRYLWVCQAGSRRAGGPIIHSPWHWRGSPWLGDSPTDGGSGSAGGSFPTAGVFRRGLHDSALALTVPTFPALPWGLPPHP